MLLHMLLFGAYAIYDALILGSNSTSASELGAPAWIETRHYVLPWCRGSVVCTAVLLAADCSLLVPPTVFSVLCVGVCASCFFVFFVLADCRC